ncbi:hypothetical protein ASG01_00655 [Chryseobacterium sp. Leaf180]|uniref:DUF262 domain-containing protein n=1 Tax=Chryseobacterium sp. Leaf180 TaxID=1736289 RepID=UPI0006F3E4FA|nr:DUF262 domain-containing protein [Chryseobacterium sp. Leaf180]KQR94432.1 hypothetical protein ASG01_00655 [Chryseobacterium sp. Leaf180]
MKNQQLKEQSLLYLLSQNNFIVPEIQREYVWGNNSDVLNRFLDSIIDKIGETCDDCGNPKMQSKINVGFLYTYKPSYISYSYERFLDENLIDGQQRFTTLFLLLFYTSLKENRIEDFTDAIRYDELKEMAFDYKVRNLTHIFLLDLISNVSTLEQLNQVLDSKTTWLLNDFNKDVTVLSMLNALRLIDSKFQTRKEKYFSFLLNNIKFYHFKTEATNQGEELYITMNARGEALSKNEENKAALMFDEISLFEFGAKWEEWQDFFWKNRDKTNPKSNADVGFNEFLRWIQIIEMTLIDKETDANEDEKISDESFAKKIITLIQGEHIQLDKQYFSIDKIEKYFKAVKYIFEDYYNDVNFQEKYENVNFDLIRKQWLCPAEKTISQIDAFRFLPVLYYVLKQDADNKRIEPQKLFRLIKYLNNLRKDRTITKTINKQVINAINLVDILLNQDSDIANVIKIEDKGISKTLLTFEERCKFSIYLNSKNREDVESAFWLAEDHKILNGKIGPILQISYYDSKSCENFEYSKNFSEYSSNEFNINHFKELLSNFFKLTQEDQNHLSDNIWASMLLTPYYSLKYYNENHSTVSCLTPDDFELLRNKLFLCKLFEISKYDSANSYFQNIFELLISNYSSLENLSEEIDYKHQIYFYYRCLKPENKWDFGKGKNFGVYLKPKKHTSFFNTNVRFQHYRLKWQGAEYNYFDDNKKHLNKFYQPLFN